MMLPNTTTKTANLLQGWARGLFVVLVLALNLLLPVARATSSAPAVLGPAGGCNATALQQESCCCAPAETSSCCSVKEVVSCGCTTRRAPLPTERGHGPTPLLAPTGDVAADLHLQLERAAHHPVLAGPLDGLSLRARIDSSPPPERATHPPAPPGTAARIGLLRGNAARQAFLAVSQR